MFDWSVTATRHHRKLAITTKTLKSMLRPKETVRAIFCNFLTKIKV